MVIVDREKNRTTLCSGIFAADVFRGISPGSEASLSQIRCSGYFAPGTSIFKTGEPPAFVFVLRSGTARISTGHADDCEINSRFACASEIFGLTESIANSNFEIGCDAVTGCEFDLFETDEIIRFLESEPSVCLHLARSLGDIIMRERQKGESVIVQNRSGSL